MKKFGIVLIVLMLCAMTVSANAVVRLPEQMGTFEYELTDKNSMVAPFTFKTSGIYDGCFINCISTSGQHHIRIDIIDVETGNIVYTHESLCIDEESITGTKAPYHLFENGKEYLVEVSKTTQENITGVINISEVELVDGEPKEIKQFKDYPSYKTYFQLFELKSKDILNGYEDNTLKPKQNVTKAEWIKMVAVTFGYTKDYVPKDFFEDVKENYWVYPYVSYCCEKGLIADEDILEPETEISLRDAMGILIKGMGYSESYAFKQGGNDGYAIIAKEMGVFKNTHNIEFTDSFKRVDAALCIFNTLDKPMMVFSTDERGTTTYVFADGKNNREYKNIRSTYFK